VGEGNLMGISSGLGGAVGAVPAGAVMPFAGADAPAGWLLCAGQVVSRSQFGELFATIGTTYGAGDGSTTFALPDLRGRVVAGVDTMGGGTRPNRLTSTTITGGADAVGEVGGGQTHTLTTAEMPSHNHTATSTPQVYSESGANWDLRYGDGNRLAFNRNTNISTSIGNTGSGNAHNNVQPTMVLNYIIKA
jgi:microcystin-dependent protein